ncbi:MAG: hypothetical protein FWF49_01440 [Oscillospiraceae bacterium]|nr:hypothetical protein [Oscillospiraceae bacterium]
MTKFLTLLRVNVQALMTQMLAFRRRRGRRSVAGPAAGAVGLLVCAFIMGYVGLYSAFICGALKDYGMLWFLPLMVFTMIALLNFIMNIFTITGFLFTGNDLEQLFTYPMSKAQIVASKLLSVIAQNMLIGFLIAAPSLAVYAWYAHPSLWFYPMAVVGFVLTPLLPTALAAVVSYLINLLSMGSRVKGIVNAVLALAAIGAWIYFIPKMISMFAAGTMQELLTSPMGFVKIYAPAALLTSALANNNGLHFLLFLAVALVPFALLTLGLGAFYGRLWSRIAKVKRTRAARGTIKQGSALSALLRKEWGRYLSSTMYMLNTAMGGILALVFSVAIVFFGQSALNAILPLLSNGAALVFPMCLLVLCFCLALSSTTAPSVSLEGKQLWIVKTMPVTAGRWLLAKLLVHLTVMLPVTVVSAVLLAVGLHFTLWQGIALVLLPALLVLLGGLLGLIFNLRYYRFDFFSDMQVVKNSSSVLLTMGCQVLGVGAGIGLYFVPGLGIGWTVLILGALLAVGNIAAGRYLAANGERLYAELG